MKLRFISIAAAAVLLVAQAANAQMASPARGEQTADRPDLSGVWQKSGGGPGLLPVEQEPPLTEWGRERFNLAKPIHGPRTTEPTEANAPELQCLPMGIPGAYFRPRPFEIVQLENRAIMLFEVDTMWRMIYMDGREFPEIPLHTWNGYAIGHYESDALVIETRHIRGWESAELQRWLDRLGYPFSDQLRVVERIRRIDEENLQNEITIDDPVAYTRPWTTVMNYRLREFELAEFICAELMLSDLPAMRPGQE
jgi:hypothetical protein